MIKDEWPEDDGVSGSLSVESEGQTMTVSIDVPDGIKLRLIINGVHIPLDD